MKKSLRFAAVLACAISLCGCSKDDDIQTEKQSLDVIGGASVTTDSMESASSSLDSSDDNSIGSETSESGGTVQTGPIGNTANAEGQAAQTGIAYSADGSASAASVPAVSADNEAVANIFGAQGKTDSEWLAFGQELYKKGCDTAFRFLCTGSQFPFDTQNLDIIDKTYFLTTCASFDEATEEYYEIFSKQYHSSDFDGLLIESGGRLYAARGARGMDMTYLSSAVDNIIETADTEVTFSVTAEYEDEVTTSEFSLVYEDGEWKIGKFTLPY